MTELLTTIFVSAGAAFMTFLLIGIVLKIRTWKRRKKHLKMIEEWKQKRKDHAEKLKQERKARKKARQNNNPILGDFEGKEDYL